MTKKKNGNGKKNGTEKPAPSSITETAQAWEKGKSVKCMKDTSEVNANTPAKEKE